MRFADACVEDHVAPAQAEQDGEDVGRDVDVAAATTHQPGGIKARHTGMPATAEGQS